MHRWGQVLQEESGQEQAKDENLCQEIRHVYVVCLQENSALRSLIIDHGSPLISPWTFYFVTRLCNNQIITDWQRKTAKDFIFTDELFT